VQTGYYQGSADPGKWNAADADIDDLPGIYHNNGTTFSFADGHAERHHWLDSATLTMAFGYQVTPNNPDMIWLTTHATVPNGII